jgi:YidC/Oxa1 family membrane protein insertase
MPEPDKPKSPEISVEKRMLLAFVLVGIVLLLSQFLFSPAAPSKSGPEQTKPATAQQAVKPTAPVPPPPATEAAKPAEAAAPVAADNEQTETVETAVYRIVFSNKGAVIRSWQLKAYRDTDRKPLELVNPAGAEKTGYPLSFAFENQKPSVELNTALYVMKVTPDRLGISFEYSNGRTTATKSLRFAQNSYIFDLVTEVKENGSGIPHMLAWRGGFGDHAAYAHAASLKTLYFDLSANSLVENDASAAKEGPAYVSGTYSFAGLQDTYFLAVFLPAERQAVKLATLSDRVPPNKDAAEEAVAGAAVGGNIRNQFSVFVGPKDIDLLRRINPKLEAAVDFGWFSFLARPIFLALKWMNGYIHNYGWSIILLTVAINMLLLPLKLSGMKGMKKMAGLQPEIQAINAKYKDISLRDPRKAQQNAEIMELYKKHGVNPLGAGCMPLLLQIPFFFAFYKVLSVAIELRGADWLWISDLSHFDPLYLLPVVMVITQFVLQKMTPTTTADPAQQKMMLFMPLVFGFLFFKASAGLVLYWLTGNLVSIVQQVFINRITPAPAAATAVVTPGRPPKKPNRK